MSLPIMDWTSHSLPAGGRDYFKKLKDFLEVQGWTIKEYLEDVEWGSLGGGNYGWKAGTERFLDVESSIAAVGVQHYRWNLRIRDHTSDATSDLIYWAGVDPTVNNGDYSYVSQHPCGQSGHVWGPSENGSWCRLPRGTFTACYFFSNDVSFWSYIQMTAGTGILWGMGTPVLLPEYYNTLDVQVLWSCTDYDNPWTYLATEGQGWLSGEGFPFNPAVSLSQSNYFRIEGNNRPVTTPAWICYNIVRNRNGGTHLGYFDQMGKAATLSNYNGIRPAHIPDVYVKRLTGVYEYVGTLPLAKLNTSGLAIGSQLTYGPETYLAFPNMSSAVSLYGTIFRIA